ncbi:MAG TPA: ABC transporter permease [Gemmataceae bacterium]|jgi:rhamnose transport system permease protein|nr:ABC transporter permease [Gemmataceae bacterium]
MTLRHWPPFLSLRWTPVILPLLVLTAMIALNPALRHGETWERVGRDWTGVALLAIALTPIIITGGIDLSVGSVVGLSAIVAGVLWRDAHWPLAIALAGGLLAGLCAGMLNGAIILTGVNPLVVTLATLAVFRGLAYGICGREQVRNLPVGLTRWWDGNLFGLPQPVWIIILTFLVYYLLLHHTWMGRMFYAIGDNPRAARFAGVPVRSLTFSLYALSGLVAGVAGLATLFQFRSATATEGDNLELKAITCVVLGGVRITGGSGHLAGTLLGALTLAALLEGMYRIAPSWRTLLIGAFLVAIAIANELLARWRLRREAGNREPAPLH